MGSRGDLQTPYADAVMDTPGMGGDGVAVRGGVDLEGGMKESANSVSGLPGLPVTYQPEEGAPGAGSTIPWPDADSPGTIPTKGVGTD